MVRVDINHSIFPSILLRRATVFPEMEITADARSQAEKRAHSYLPRDAI